MIFELRFSLSFWNNKAQGVEFYVLEVVEPNKGGLGINKCI